MSDITVPLPKPTRRARAALMDAMRLADDAARLQQERNRLEAGYRALMGDEVLVGPPWDAYHQSDLYLLGDLLRHVGWLLGCGSDTQALWDDQARCLEERFGWVVPLPPGEHLGVWEAGPPMKDVARSELSECAGGS